MMARLPGVNSAPPTPCNTLAVTRTATLGAAAQAIDATVNHTEPITKIRRRPNRSPSDPPTRISEARLRV